MYNYFVSGESSSYGFAQSNYRDFVTSTNGTEWFDRLQNRVGFIVTTSDVLTNDSTLGNQLHRHNGSRSGSTSGLANYRLVHVERGGEYKVFTLVEGAEIRGVAEPNSSVTVRTTVELESYSFEYVRETQTDANGTFSVGVAQPGTYSVDGTSVTVSEEAVRNGTVVDATANASTAVESLGSIEPNVRTVASDNSLPRIRWNPLVSTVSRPDRAE
nr:hypothetical protein [Halorubellus sp. JP-L1]